MNFVRLPSLSLGPMTLVVAAICAVLLRYLCCIVFTGEASFDHYLALLCTRDCGWYANIAANGYDRVVRPDGTANWAFFPLTPLVLWCAHALTGWSWALCGLVIGEAATVLSCLLAKMLLERRAWIFFCVLVLFGPFSYAYGLGMSEPLFFFLSLLVFAGLKARVIWWVIVGAALISATRVTGIFIALPIALEIAYALLAQRRPENSRGFPYLGLVAALAAACGGMLSYMAYLAAIAGDGLAFVHIQRAWGRSLYNPVANIIEGLALAHHGGYGLTMSVFSLLGLAAAIRLALKRELGMALFTAASLIAGLSSGTISMVRFVAGLAPVSLVAASLPRGIGGLAVASIVAAVLGLLLSVMWVGGSPLLT
jgi:hypothetical protein